MIKAYTSALPLLEQFLDSGEGVWITRNSQTVQRDLIFGYLIGIFLSFLKKKKKKEAFKKHGYAKMRSQTPVRDKWRLIYCLDSRFYNQS